VLQRLDKILFSQGKYVVKLLEIFGTVEWNCMATPMEMNFENLCGEFALPKLENPSEY